MKTKIQPEQIEKYLINKRLMDEMGWTGEFRVSAKDIIDMIIDLFTPNKEPQQSEKQVRSCKTCWQKDSRNSMKGNYMPCAECNEFNLYVQKG